MKGKDKRLSYCLFFQYSWEIAGCLFSLRAMLLLRGQGRSLGRAERIPLEQNGCVSGVLGKALRLKKGILLNFPNTLNI